MEVTEKIKRLSADQLREIVKARRAVSLTGFLSANSKARHACSLRHKGWLETLNAYTNASIEAVVKTKFGDAVATATVMSAFEALCIATIAKHDLTLEEYDILTSSVISAFPEVIVLDQDWTPEPMDMSAMFPRAAQYMTPQQVGSLSAGTTEKKTRPYRRTEDLEDKVNDVLVDPADLMAALKPKPPPEAPKLTAEEALAKMLEAMKPKTEVVAVNTASPFEINAEITEVIEDIDPLHPKTKSPEFGNAIIVESPTPEMPIAISITQPKKFTPEELLEMMKSKK